MIKPAKKIVVLSIALAALVVALGLILYYLFSSNIWNANQQGNALNIPVILDDLNSDPDSADFVLDVKSGHPFHVHGTQFQIVSRNGKEPPAEELGFKDTVYVDVGEEVIIRIRFTDPGLFMYHCHILEHEDNGMMGQIRVS